MKIELTGIALSACLAMTNGLEVEAEFLDGFIEDLFDDFIEDITNHFNPVPAINDAQDAVQDAIDGVIDGACYRDAYIPHIRFPELEECTGDWRENALWCTRCDYSKYRWTNFGC